MIARVVLVTLAAAAVANAGPLEIHAPAGLVLGRDATAELRLHAEPVQLVTNAGTIAAPTRDGDELRAVWTLPVEHRPQIAIIAAIAADGSVRDWAAIPLAGQAKIKVETEPRASVIVHVDAAAFGPVTADAHGIAQVPIVVPPGVTEASTVSTSTAGNATEKRMVLGARPSPRVLAVCRADRVVVLATTVTGAPATEIPAIAVSAGTVTRAAQTAPGVFEAQLAIDSVMVASLTVTATLGGDSASCELQVPPEPPNAVALTADRAAFVAGSGAPIQLRVTFAYAGRRRPLEVTAIAIDADVGTVSAPIRDGAAFTATWIGSDAFAGHTRARLRVRAAGTEATASIELAAGPPAKIVTPPVAAVRADGETRGEIVARVVDRFGNVVTAATVTARGRGRIGPFVRRGDGAQVASYVAPRSYEARGDAVELETSGVTDRVEVPLVPIVHRFAIVARAGYMSNFGRVSAPIGAVAASAHLLDRLVVGAELGGYRSAFDTGASDETIATRVIAVPLLARVAYQRPIGQFELTIGAGLGVAFASTRVSSPSAGTTSATTGDFAAAGFASGSIRTGPGRFVLEAEYLQSTISGEVSGRIGGLAITAGYGFDL